MRSPPRGRRIVELAPPMDNSRLENAGQVRDFRSWNPASLDDSIGHQQAPVADAAANAGYMTDSGGAQAYANEAKRQQVSIARYWAVVEARVKDGSPNALGAGAKSPLVDLPLVRRTVPGTPSAG